MRQQTFALIILTANSKRGTNMILRMLTLMLALACSLTSQLFAGGERGNQLIAELGGTPGIPGAVGIPGAGGIPGIPGIPGGTATILGFADFFAIMPIQNPGSIGPNMPVAFPNTSANFGGFVNGGNMFTLPATATYLVMFQASVTPLGAPSGQLMLSVNGVPQPSTVVGRDTASTQIVGISLLPANAGDILRVINPPGNLNIVITPNAGQVASPVTAHLVIVRIL